MKYASNRKNLTMKQLEILIKRAETQGVSPQSEVYGPQRPANAQDRIPQISHTPGGSTGYAAPLVSSGPDVLQQQKSSTPLGTAMFVGGNLLPGVAALDTGMTSFRRDAAPPLAKQVEMGQRDLYRERLKLEHPVQAQQLRAQYPGGSYYGRSPYWNTTKNFLGRTAAVGLPGIDVWYGPRIVKDRYNAAKAPDANTQYVAQYAGPWYNYMNQGLEGLFGVVDAGTAAGSAGTLAYLAGGPIQQLMGTRYAPWMLRGMGRLGAAANVAWPLFLAEGAYELGKAGRDAIVEDTRGRETSYASLNETEQEGRELQQQLARVRPMEAEKAQAASEFIRQQQEANAKLHWASEPEFQVNYESKDGESEDGESKDGKRITRRAEVSKRPSGWSGSFIDWMDQRYRDWMNAPQVARRRRNPETGREEDYNVAAYAYRLPKKKNTDGRTESEPTTTESKPPKYILEPDPAAVSRDEGWKTPIDLERKRVTSTSGKNFMPWYWAMFADNYDTSPITAEALERQRREQEEAKRNAQARKEHWDNMAEVLKGPRF